MGNCPDWSLQDLELESTYPLSKAEEMDQQNDIGTRFLWGKLIFVYAGTDYAEGSGQNGGDVHAVALFRAIEPELADAYALSGSVDSFIEKGWKFHQMVPIIPPPRYKPTGAGAKPQPSRPAQ